METSTFEQRIEKQRNSKAIISSGKDYVVGLQMEGVDYTVKLVIGVKNGTTYYDHALTQIGKEKLLRSIDEIKRPFASKESSDNGELASDVLSECNDDANESRAKLV